MGFCFIWANGTIADNTLGPFVCDFLDPMRVSLHGAGNHDCPSPQGQCDYETPIDLGGELGYMTYRGVALKLNNFGNMWFLGFPDVMVIVLPHLYFIVLPAIISIIMLAVERESYHVYLISLSIKKKDDTDGQNKEGGLPNSRPKKISELILLKQSLRKFFHVASLAISVGKVSASRLVCTTCWGTNSCRAA